VTVANEGAILAIRERHVGHSRGRAAKNHSSAARKSLRMRDTAPASAFSVRSFGLRGGRRRSRYVARLQGTEHITCQLRAQVVWP
jgi:hypothetical protein